MSTKYEPFIEMASPSEHPAQYNSTVGNEQAIPETFQPPFSNSSLFRALMITAIPSIIAVVCLQLLPTLTLHFVGQLEDTTIYNATALALSTLYCLAIYLILSLNMGFTAVASHAHGAGKFELVGIYLHKNIIINLILLTCGAIFMYNSYELLIYFGIEPQIAEISAYFLRQAIWISFLFMITDSFKSFLFAQNQYIPQFVIQFIVAVLHWFYCQALIVPDNKLSGALEANFCSVLSGAVLMIGYLIIFRPKRELFFWLRKESFKDLFSFYKTELPIGAMVYLEWIFFHILVFLSTRLTPGEMAAFITLGNMMGMFYIIPLGLSMAITTLVGNAIGEGNIEKTKSAIRISLYTAGCILLVEYSLWWIFSDSIITFYTHDPEITSYIKKLMTISCFSFPMDFVQSVLAGIIKGIGKEKVASQAFSICMYAIGLPICYIACFILDYRATGLWFGIAVAISLVAITFIILVWRVKLEDQINMIDGRLKEDQKLTERKAE